jgi:uncharacterized caspase-like protein/peptidoglycan hydrolase-like protein with peptidoglycan-binding domain
MRLFSRVISVLSLVLSLASGLLLFLTPASAEVERRVALVIGNGAYKAAPVLPNPPIDAKAVAAAFRRLHFEVIDGYDLTIIQMREKIAEFSSAISESKAAIVYYAGHGVSVDEENYLLPTDIALKTPTDLDLNAISLSLVLKQMKREERVNVVILDACRDNPFAAELARAKTRAVIGDRGLSRVDGELTKGTLLAFASDPKSTALDGAPGENSPFTKALLNHLEDPGVSIDTVMNRVRAEVWTETKNKQMPWVNTSIIGEFVLNPQVPNPQVAALAPDTGSLSGQAAASVTPSVVPLVTLNQDRLAQETRLWDSAERANSVEDYQAYLDAYPSGVYARMANNRIARLGAPNAVLPGVNSTADFSSEALKAEIGTQESEKTLPLTLNKRREVQQRLLALAFEPGKISGVFNEKTRRAIANWQKGHQLSATGWLAPLQYSALLTESETPLRRFLAEKSAPPPSQPANAHHRTPASGRSMVTVHHSVQPRAAAPVRVARRTQHSYATRQGQGQGQGQGFDPSGAAFIGGLVGGAAAGFLGHRF